MEEGRWKMTGAADGPKWTRANKGYRRLVVWQRSDELASELFRLTNDMELAPWLRSQIMRAAMSVPANIVEGNARASAREYVRFLETAFASLSELDYFLFFLNDNGLLADEPFEKLVPLLDEISNKLVALMRSVSKAETEGTWQRIGEYDAKYLAVSDPESDSHLPSSTFHLPGGEGPGG